MPETPLDPADRRILTALQRDARLTNLALADAVGISPSACLRRVRALEETGLIEAYTARVNRRKLGLGVTAFVMVRLDRHGALDPAAIRRALEAMPEVLACWVTSGEFDLLLQVVTPDMEAYGRFSLTGLLGLPGIRDIRTSFAIDAPIPPRPVPLGHLP